MIVSSYRARIRSAVAALGVAVALAAAGAATVIASGTSGSAAAAPLVEDEGANCPVTLPGTLTANSKLPDPFRKIDGTRITSRSEWTCRREEIKQLAERYVYGTKPARPTVSGTVSSTNISVNVSANGRSASFSAGVQLPSGSGPFPAVVVVGGLGADTSTILGSGVAIINYNPLAVGAEGTPRNNKQGAFYTLYGATSSTGLLVAWAWGVSRIIDVIEQSGGNVLKADALGVTGCSRYGKGAFASGAFDQRIALTMPIESGSAGVPILRGIPGESGAQPLSSAYSEQPWLGDAFNSFTGNPTTLPVDTHELVGMVAPRGLFIMENPHIDWLAARSGSVAALAGAEIYKALGAGDNISYWSDVQDGTHCAVRPEWKAPLQQNLQKFLLKTGNAAGVFRISSLKAGNLSDWKDWQTPTLSDSPPSSPPPSGGACRAVDVISPWNTGLTSNITITNTSGSAINGWSLVFTLPSGQSIVPPGWNATDTPTSGQVTATNLTFNASLPPGGSTTVGFQANHTGNAAAPTAFTLNGTPCTTG
ncbi:MAG: cellulose-binding domain-containing protein [Mycobacteriales bacterium]